MHIEYEFYIYLRVYSILHVMLLFKELADERSDGMCWEETKARMQHHMLCYMCDEKNSLKCRGNARAFN
jgi:hypothetical protein